MSVSESRFVLFLERFKRLIEYASVRYSIDGILEKEVLYQEGLIVLYEILDIYDGKADDEEVCRRFKAALFYKMLDQVKFYKCRCRDWKLTVNNNATDEEVDLISSCVEDDYYLSPYEYMEHKNLEKFFDYLVCELIEERDDEALVVLNEIAFTRQIDKEIMDSFERFPRNLSYQILSKVLNKNYGVVRGALNRIRSKCIVICPKFDISVAEYVR